MEKIYDEFSLETISNLADIVNDKELSEITIESKDKKITIKGKKIEVAPPAPIMPYPSVTVGENVSVSSPAQVTAVTNTVDGNAVKSPIVGTFYSAPSPTDKPFVSVGQKVKKGDVIFIIESMKVMSEVQSEFDGVVKDICVCSGDPVEFDQTIMIIG